MAKPVWVVAAQRTPIGKFQGCLSRYSAPQLGAHAIDALFNQYPDLKSNIDEVLMGCVLPAGCGQAPARQAALGAGIALDTPCTTVNKVCGSGMKAVMLACDQIRLNTVVSAVAGGMESMTNAPYLLRESRRGHRMGHKQTHDHMFLDGLQDAYQGDLMGVFAERTSQELRWSREQMDAWSKQSWQRAMEAQERGLFDAEISPLDDKTSDEIPASIDPEKIPKLKPAFSNDGVITAANASAIADGAAALLLMDGDYAQSHGYQPIAKIMAYASHARSPEEFTVAPADAIEKVLSLADWNRDEVDLWEINEAFAVVTQIAIAKLGLSPNVVNVKGGACAIGHPIGASGARILVTLIHSLHQWKAAQAGSQANSTEIDRPPRGVASLCIGGGEATAVAIELPS